MKEMELIVESKDNGSRLDSYLAENLADFSRSHLKKIIKDGNIEVDGKVEKPRYLIQEGDVIRIRVEEPQVLDVAAQDIPIDIVYEDENLLVVNKPQDMVVHPAPGNYEGTLVNAIMYHCKDNLSSINGVVRPGIVHRIDKNTSGLLVIAKDDKSHNSLAEQFKDHSITRKYNFICHGRISKDEFTVDQPLGRNPKNRLQMAVVQNGKRAVTHFKVLKRFEKFTYLEAQLETGRTHQIRAHMKYVNHPLLGDDLYGPKNASKFNLKGQTLHARTLGFIHPVKGAYVEFEQDLPEYFEKLLRALK